MNNINFEALSQEILATQENALASIKENLLGSIDFDYNSHCVARISRMGHKVSYCVYRKQGSQDLVIDLEIDLNKKKVLSSRRRNQKGEDFYSMELNYAEAVEVLFNLYEAHSK